MTSSHPSAGTFWRKLGFQAFGLFASFGVVAWGAVAGYQYYKSASVVKEARGQFERGDFRAAHSTALRALQEDPSLLEPAKISAESLEKLNSPEAVEAWGKIAQMQNGDVQATVRWAQSALAWKRDTVAFGALQVVPEAKRADASYQATLGEIFVAQDKFSEAEAALAKARELLPSNADFVLKHASLVASHSDDPVKIADAEKALRTLLGIPKSVIPARRALASLKVRQKDWNAALEENKALMGAASPTIEDRVQRVEILRQMKSSDFPAALEALQKSTREARETSVVFDWMNRSGMATEALRWSESMEPRIARNPEVARRIAESHMANKDWRALRKQCDDLENWGDELDYLRHAYAALALRQMDDLINSNYRWTAAVGAASASRESTPILMDLAESWGWRDEVRDILWSSANRIDARWALNRLTTMYTKEGSTEGLHRVYTRMTELSATDDTARNRMVHFSMLLDRNTETSVAQARMLAKRHPNDPVFAATAALAELKGGRGIDALSAFGKIPAEKLQAREVALYHGLALFAAGHEQEAGKAFAVAQKQPLLLEETLLIPQSFRATVRGN